jgi:tRNA nucleotidyltransferase (CCA-adding enzyme)
MVMITPVVQTPPPAELIEAVRRLRGGPEALERLADVDGVYLVGGAPRDLLLGGVPRELDLVVEGDAAAVAARLGGEIRVHDRFGTCTVNVGGVSYDLARARTETYEHPGALPLVAPADLDADLLRRDFTVNAIAITLGGAEAGAVRAVPDALADLEAHQLRVLHDASFRDDPTRLLRLVRYASRLHFAVESHTEALAAQALEADAMRDVSGPRIGNELRLLVAERDPIAALTELAQQGVGAAISPRLYAPDPVLAERAMDLLPDDGSEPLLLLALSLDAAAPHTADVAELLDHLAFPAPERDRILAAAARAPTLAAALAAAHRPSEIAGAARDAGPELVALAGALGPEEAAREWLTRLRHVRLELDGNDLLRAGIRSGPAVGAGLKAALAAKLDGTATGREQELAAALEAAKTSQ